MVLLIGVVVVIEGGGIFMMFLIWVVNCIIDMNYFGLVIRKLIYELFMFVLVI